CYHKKLSIAANCRMCLVDVEKAAKPLPACATPVTEGMKVYTQSTKAIMAQKGVMEFLLINHPLDCPICDQGGECELQDLAMGYGASGSRYQEKKRVVKDKNIGPLIMTDMTRCIHCTRCIRFGQEIAGLMELGATGRGEHMEIGTYIEKAMVSELSGNVIDLCPVGALTSKPFRYTARAWEMAQRETIAPHDSVGSNLYLHVRGNKVMRVVPRENEEINEVWISDRDRFSYQGLNIPDRLKVPMLKRHGMWEETDWNTALQAVVKGLRDVIQSHGAEQIGALVSPSATLEEMYLLQRLMRGLGVNNIDNRLRQSDFNGQMQAPPFPSLGIAIAGLQQLDAVLLIGSNVRREQPIIAHRLRQATQSNDARMMVINSVDYDFAFPVAEKIITGPTQMVRALAGIAKALLEEGTQHVPAEFAKLLATVQPAPAERAMAQRLKTAQSAAVLLGNIAQAHPQFSMLNAWAGLIAELSGARFGHLPEAANSVGGWIAGAIPHREAAGKTVAAPGLDSHAMLTKGLKAYVLFGIEPEYDTADPAAALKSLNNAEFVVAVSAFNTKTMQNHADVLLPIGAYAETSGTFVNAEGRWQSFAGAVSPAGEARPGWKVVRVLGNLFAVKGFDYLSSEEVRDEIRSLVDQAGQQIPVGRWAPTELPGNTDGLMRIADVPMYAVDALVRRAQGLQETDEAQDAALRINSATARLAGLSAGQFAQARQGEARAVLAVEIDDRVADGCVLISAALPKSAGLGPAFGPITVERA
ncbi:MAG: NADH-quinone oxidoreductase subunit NuoG, partial [Gammaproteobacteria bacterium]